MRTSHLFTMQKPLLALKTRVRKEFQNSRTMYRTANNAKLHDTKGVLEQLTM